MTADQAPEGVATRLDALCDEYWTFCREEQPFSAILAGEYTEDTVLYRESVADHDRRARRARQLLEHARAIDAGVLEPGQRVSLELLRGELQLVLDLQAQDAHLRPSLFPTSPDFNLSYLASAFPIANATQAKRYRLLLESAETYLHDLRDAVLAGMEAGYAYPRRVVERSAQAMEANRVGGLRADLLAPLQRTTAKGDLTTSVEAVERLLDDRVLPALDDLVATLRGPVLARARDSLGLCADRNGDLLYRTLCRQFTSLDMAPEDIHVLGLAEVDRLREDQFRLARDAGHASLEEFRAFLHASPQFRASSSETHLASVRALCKRIDGEIPGFFATLPRISYGVELIPEARADSTPPAYAQPSPGDASRPGIFWITPQLEKCPTYLYPSLALHEAWPGHLMQIALMQEQADLPAFRRFGALKYTACIEGWAMYCEWLGEEMGIYDSAAERFGRLDMEMWRAVRLVLDTGLHLMGWDRQRAVDYMGEHVSLAPEAIAAEVDRYIALPGQALAYQLGNRAMRRLRARAEAALADRLDLRRFHDEIIRCGPVSLAVLESVVDDWIQGQGEAA